MRPCAKTRCYILDSTDKDFDSDGNQDTASEDGSFSGKSGAKGFPDDQSAHADKEGNDCDDEGTDESHDESIIRDGKSDR